MQLHGIHHLTAISADARGNHAFYTDDLGLRLVKKTVNQDDVSAYHLFYADGRGSPGSDITFFEWPVQPERRGTNAIVRTGLRVGSEEAILYWRERLEALGFAVPQADYVDGRLTLPFEDREGQRLALLNDEGGEPSYPWERSPVPASYQIRGLGPITLSVPTLDPTAQFLIQVLNMRHERDFETEGTGRVHVFAMGEGGPAAELHIRVEPELPRARQGAGAVHHVAFRCRGQEEYRYWVERYRELGVPSSGPVDRFYFRSLYAREPGGILCEIATDEPGFATDEPEATMGARLALPPFLEAQRAEIEKGLKPL
ncbi:glyoxalase family protein [Arboricoccus pini]|uniref:Glyoxalase family protein n=1 Tax=Arboricoccus pini TaxID=1963835 RepID=A0A212RDV3_9PROT|nr:ring-cleaving dioxygenase [Arboricoccus pini]SNB70474.1 glyoxalase family protein [Arboricoccus pini]